MPDCTLCIPGKKNIIWEGDGLQGLKYLRDNNFLCEFHQEFADEKIKLIPKKFVLNTGEVKPFVPEIPNKVFKNYQDREPGEEG